MVTDMFYFYYYYYYKPYISKNAAGVHLKALNLIWCLRVRFFCVAVSCYTCGAILTAQMACIPSPHRAFDKLA